MVRIDRSPCLRFCVVDGSLQRCAEVIPVNFLNGDAKIYFRTESRKHNLAGACLLACLLAKRLPRTRFGKQQLRREPLSEGRGRRHPKTLASFEQKVEKQTAAVWNGWMNERMDGCSHGKERTPSDPERVKARNRRKRAKAIWKAALRRTPRLSTTFTQR